MKEEFKLIDKIDDKESVCQNCGHEYCTYEETYFKLKDVKEFIKLLKEEIKSEVLLCNCEIAEDRAEEIINNLSGEFK